MGLTQHTHEVTKGKIFTMVKHPPELADDAPGEIWVKVTGTCNLCGEYVAVQFAGPPAYETPTN